MSSVASPDSDGATTTGSTANSVASNASTVASAASEASRTSTVASSVNSADSGTGTAEEKSLKELEEWYNKGPKNDPRVSSWLKATPNPSSMLSVTEPNDIFGLANDSCKRVDFLEGVTREKDNDGEMVTEVSADLSGPAGRKIVQVKGANGEEDCTLVFTWGPAASGENTTFSYTRTASPPPTNTATDTKKTMPSLAPFLELPNPTIPPPSEVFKSYDPKTAKMARSMGLEDWIEEYPVVKRYEKAKFSQQQCYDFDMNDRAMLEALKKAKIDAKAASNFALIDKSSHYIASQVEKVPSAIASFVLNVYDKLIPEEDENSFKKALEKSFTERLSHPKLPVTDAGLCTYRWASTLMDGGELKRVDPKTALGRHITMRKVRADIWNETEASYNAVTDAATKVTDWYHRRSGLLLQELTEYAKETLGTGGKVPNDCPQSILDIAEARDEKTKAMSEVSYKSTTPSALSSLGKPIPAAVLAHEAQTSGSNINKSHATTGTKTSLPDSLLQRLKRVEESIGSKKVQGFFDRFPPQRTAVSAC